ncbi:MAG: S8 family serine peptidase, partial [Aliifodinibius sp.]|nr:S8 family serine peptidase [candidate division Zixibacteria bacterium]NIT55951.1 S8 family serine peptidase [Fodinibius sp.]NIW44093.1 S8 family serine peptidase [Gammaproteobacteria bacterium]NIS45135.1 S8 family serine peptidase [candidate division Zixibacteria bacterium]NIU13295.1 S8 family serine peptidase [candidate division Zixibacteria bacterium]
SQWKFRRFYRAIFDSAYAVDEVVNVFENELEVIFAEPNYIFELYGNPNDPHFDKQWGLRKIKADSAWQIESGNSSVIVGVIDTGTDLVDNNGNPHEDLWANLWNENGMYGYNVLDTVKIPDDDNGHGTHVAGIAGAVTNNNNSVAGTANGGFHGNNDVRVSELCCKNLIPAQRAPVGGGMKCL